MAWSARKAASSGELGARRNRKMADQRNANLPEYEQRRLSDPKIVGWMADLEARLRIAVDDADEISFEQIMGGWLKGAQRINEIIAEEYRQAHPDPATWDLRYFRWMRVAYIRFESPAGEFCLVPRRGRRPPTTCWYTADEMIDLLGSPALAEVLTLTNKLPQRPESLRPPAADEKHLHIDATGSELSVRYEIGGMNAGTGFRRRTDGHDS